MPANQRKVLWNLLVLVIDWTSSGSPRETGLTMRQFTPWAESVGGFLIHHGIKGFLTNIESVRNIDEDAERWMSFLATWRKIHGDREVTAHELRLSADTSMGIPDPWDGTFVTGRGGKPLSPVSLGKLLRGQIGRWRGSYVLRSPEETTREGKRVWRVEERQD